MEQDFRIYISGMFKLARIPYERLGFRCFFLYCLSEMLTSGTQFREFSPFLS